MPPISAWPPQPERCASWTPWFGLDSDLEADVDRHSQFFRLPAAPGICFAILLLLVCSIYPQVPPPPPGPVPPPGQNTSAHRATFSLTMSQVIVDVSVTNRAGKPIENLTKDDFEIYEDGKRQAIRACQFER